MHQCIIFDAIPHKSIRVTCVLCLGNRAVLIKIAIDQGQLRVSSSFREILFIYGTLLVERKVGAGRDIEDSRQSRGDIEQGCFPSSGGNV
jgi:hypothetical protein